MKQHHLIYVPGILDDIYFSQSTPLRTWRLYGLRAHIHEMPWAGPDAYEPKLERLVAKIDKYADQGHKVSLLGASAGASAVLNAYVERRDKITSLAYICGKINDPERVSPKLYQRNWAFKDSLYRLQKNLRELTPGDKAKMRSYYSPADKTVAHDQTVIPGVSEEKLPSLGHATAILYSLSFGAHRLAKFLKSPQ
jgi:hypothetical protein